MRIARIALVVLAVAQWSGITLAKKPAAGRPAFKNDDPEAFWIWSDDSGWHLRGSVPKKQSHKFHGVIRSQGISDAKGSRPSLSSALQATATSIRFEFTLSEGGDGFDWKTTAQCVTLELKIDDKPQPANIHIGEKAESPTAMPFDACRP